MRSDGDSGRNETLGPGSSTNERGSTATPSPRAASERISVRSLASTATPGLHAGAGQRRVEPLPRRGARFERDQRISGERGQRQRPPAGERVTDAGDGRELLAGELETVDPVRRLSLERKREVEAPVAQHREHSLRGSLPNADLHVREAGREAREDRRNVELAAEQHRAGHEKLELETFSALRAAAHLYLAAGFRVASERETDMWGPAIVFQRYELRLS